MKNLLLGTTALIGALGISASAAMAEGPKVTLGGVIDFQAGYISQDLDANQRHHAFRQDTEININVDGKTDAGLGYGALVALEADTTADADGEGVNAAKTLVYLQGDRWGRVEMGSMPGVATTLKLDASNIASATGGIDGDFYYWLNSNGQPFIITPDLTLGYGAGNFGSETTENNNKISYYTPRWSGFQLGVSYSVDPSDKGQAIQLSDNDAGEAENIFDLALNYQGQWDMFKIGFAAIGELGSAEAPNQEDLRAYSVGVLLGYAGFSFVGSWGDWTDSLLLNTPGIDDDQNFFTLGAAYEMNQFSASVTYLNSERQDNDFSNLVLGVDYKLAPGLTPYAEFSYSQQDGRNLVSLDNDASVLILGTQLAF